MTGEEFQGAVRPHVTLVVPVWGEVYLDTFLSYSLPAQLSVGNVPVLGEDARHRYVIYTTGEGRRRCEEHPLLAQLTRHITVTFKPLEALASYNSGDSKYRTKSECYAIELKSASTSGAAVAMLNADILLADGFIREVLRLLAAGMRVIEVTGGRGLQDPIQASLNHSFRRSDGTISIAPPELSRLWLANLHPQLAMHYVDGPDGGSFHPSHLYWLVGDEGVIIRGFHLYPIVVKPNTTPLHFAGTIDDDLVASLAAPREERFLAQDSRQLFCCELSPPEHYVGDVAWRGDRQSVVNFYLGYRRENIANLEKEIIITNRAELGELWEQRRHDSREFAESLMRDLSAEIARREGAQPLGAGILRLPHWLLSRAGLRFLRRAMKPSAAKPDTKSGKAVKQLN